MQEHRFSLSPKEADLVARAISSALVGNRPPWTPREWAFLLSFKNSLLRRVPGRRPHIAGVLGEPVTRLED